jgi:uncharacterized protein
MLLPDPDIPRVFPPRIAVIGSGISGLSAAWLMSKGADVTLYEAERRLGGHSNTLTIEDAGRPIDVDSGFIVYNDRNYPNLVALFGHLQVATHASEMSFSASLEDGAFEYAGAGAIGFLRQGSNLISPRFWRLVRDIVRFYREAPAVLKRPELADLSLGDFLDRAGYSRALIEDHLLPMGAAIWSTTAKDMKSFPVHAFLRFFMSHGLLDLVDRPQWRTVTGGSKRYVERLAGAFRGKIRAGTPVSRIERLGTRVAVTDASGQVDHFTDVVLACHADQTLAMMADADDAERKLLGAFRYTDNRVVVHADPHLMPRRRSVWASWNYLSGKAGVEDGQLCVSYWMNRLQGIKSSRPIFVTLNPSRAVREDLVHTEITYTHPLFDAAALSAQKDVWALQGRRGTWFCGAYMGSGFHEDGLQAGLAVAEAVTGVRRPWQVADESGRLSLPAQRVAAE